MRDVIRQTLGHPIFDAHLHANPPHVIAPIAEMTFGVHRKTAHNNILDPDELLARTVAHMDVNGIQQGLLSGRNEMVQEWVRAQPGRFIPSFKPDLALTDHRDAAEQLAEDIRGGRWCALGELSFSYFGISIGDPQFFPYYDVCQHAGVPVLFHSGLGGPDPQRLVFPRFRVELGDPLLLQEVVIAFPDLKIVIMHMGWPFFDHALYMLYSYPNVYLDVAFVNWVLPPRLFHRLLDDAVQTGGSDRILFGTDQMAWPQMIDAAVLSIVEADCLTELDRENIFWKNAAALFGLEKPVPATHAELRNPPA